MTTISSETKQLLPYAMLRGFGPQTIQQVARLNNFAELRCDEVIRYALGSNSVIEDAAWDEAVEASEHQINESQRHGIRILSVFDRDYPRLLSADDTEVLSDFTHRLRTTVSKVRMAKKGEPLFIRHTASAKRSSGGGGDRTDPTGQITTIHINPEYRGKLDGRHVIVVDDCTTYGVSFAVAAAFLKKAGASKVTGLALGKFGNQLRHYDIEINPDPYAPVTDFTENSRGSFGGVNNTAVLHDLTELV